MMLVDLKVVTGKNFLQQISRLMMLMLSLTVDETVYLQYLVQSCYKEAAVVLVSAWRIPQVCLHAILDFQLSYRVDGAAPPCVRLRPDPY